MNRWPVTELGDALTQAIDAVGKIATDVATLSRTEIGELAEGTGGGSSAMPQKQNPAASVLIRSAALRAPNLAATLHLASALAADERPDGAWHAEWPTLRELLRLALGATGTAADLVEGLRVDGEAGTHNVSITGGLIVAERLSLVLTPVLGKDEVTRIVGEAGRGGDLAALVREALEHAVDRVPGAAHPADDVDALLDVPIVYASGRAGAASRNRPENGELPDNDDLEPLFAAILEHIPAPSYDDEAPLQAWVTNLDSSPFLGRLALLRVFNGTLKKGQTVAWVRSDGSTSNARITELLMTRALERYPAESAGPGDIVAIAGFEDITIGETIADPEDIRPLPAITVDDPAISMTIGTNTSPLVGKVKGHKLTARMVKDRLDRELIGNVSLKVVDIGRPDTWEVQGRGELALAILVENMRREGFELTVGKPQVVTKKIDGVVHEPFEHLTVDAPEEYLGAITQLLANRKGRMENMTNHGTGWVRMEFVVPSRGLIGFRSEFLTTTRGTGIANAISHGYEPWAGQITTRQNGSIVADRSGVVTPFAMIALQERMSFFVQPTEEVYEGMVIGENSRADDMDVNITKEKKLTNMRSSTADNFESMTPPRLLTLEESLEFARDDECVEVTPEKVRIRKVILDQTVRGREASRLKRQDANA
ncbi:MAG: translational GTPase TypA [Microbacterium sp.]|nr:translational GTPase TypA [Microbacterium sp.]